MKSQNFKKHQKTPDKFPSHLIDPETGAVRRFATRGERFVAEILPAVGSYGLQALKLALVAPVTGWGAAAAMVPVALAVKALAKRKAEQDRARDFEKIFVRNEGRGLALFDLSSDRDRDRLQWKYGEKHAGFAADILALSALARLPEPPRIAMIEDRALRDMINGTQRAAVRHAVGSMVAPDGKSSILLLGPGLPEKLDPAELRAAAATEIANIALRRDRAAGALKSRRMMGAAVTGLVVLAAAVTALPLVTAIGIGLVAATFGLAVDALQRNRGAALADRGAVLLTGDPRKAMAAAHRMQRMAGLEPNRNFGPVLRAMGLGPVPVRLRLKALKAFEKKHPAFCAARRAGFSPAFNAVAVPPAFSATPPANENAAPRKKPGRAV